MNETNTGHRKNGETAREVRKGEKRRRHEKKKNTTENLLRIER